MCTTAASSMLQLVLLAAALLAAAGATYPAVYLGPYTVGSGRQQGQQAPVAASQPGAGAVPMMPYPWVFAPQMGSPYQVPNYVPQGLFPAQPAALPDPASNAIDAPAPALTLDQVIAPYVTAPSANRPSSQQGAVSSVTTAAAVASSSATNVTSSDTASPMPMATLLSVVSNFASGMRVVASNFLASVVVMGAGQLARILFQNLPIILGLFGLTRESTARIIADGVRRAQCLERAACLMGAHARTYESTPQMLRWLSNPDQNAPEHPVWGAFRSAAEGADLRCDRYVC